LAFADRAVFLLVGTENLEHRPVGVLGVFAGIRGEPAANRPSGDVRHVE